MSEDKLVEVLDDLRADMERVYDYYTELSKESDRGAAILAAATFEGWISAIIMGYFVKLNSELERKLLEYGPLSTFSAKIDFAFALGLYNKPTRKNLHIIRNIRNQFSHSTEPMKFENESISVLCRKLDIGDTSDLDNSRTKYLKFLERAQGTIGEDLWSGKAERRRKREDNT